MPPCQAPPLTPHTSARTGDDFTGRPASSAPALPKGLAKWAANLVSKSVWWPTLSPDEIERRYIDDATVPGDWDAVGVTPSEIENHAITYLRRYRSAYVYGPSFQRLRADALTATTSFARLRSRRVLRRCKCNGQTCYLRLGRKNDKDLQCIRKTDDTQSTELR